MKQTQLPSMNKDIRASKRNLLVSLIKALSCMKQTQLPSKSLSVDYKSLVLYETDANSYEIS